MSRYDVLAVVVAALGVAGCGPEVGPEDLTRPTLEWAQGDARCSKIVAVDGAGRVWRDQGCEAPINLHSVNAISANEVNRLWTLFDALPRRPVTDIQGCAGRSHWFQRYDTAAAVPDTAAVACTAATQYDDLSDLPGDFRQLAEALIAIQ